MNNVSDRTLNLEHLNQLIYKLSKFATKYENKYKTEEIPIDEFVKKFNINRNDLEVLFNEMEMDYYNGIGIVNSKRLISISTKMRLEVKNQKIINKYNFFQSILVALILPLIVSVAINLLFKKANNDNGNNCNCNTQQCGANIE